MISFLEIGYFNSTLLLMPSKFCQFKRWVHWYLNHFDSRGAAMVDSLTCCPTGSQCGAGGLFRSRC